MALRIRSARRSHRARPACACAGLVACAALAAIAPTIVRLAARPAPRTATELHTRAVQAKSASAESSQVLEALTAHAAFARRYGQLRRAFHRTEDMLAENPDFARWRDVPERRARMEAEWAAYSRRVGIATHAEWSRVVEDGLALARVAMRRGDLPADGLAAAHLAHGYILLYADRPQAAIQAAREASGRGADPLSVALLRADACEDMGRYPEAVEHLRIARARVNAWADRAPQWETRLWWAMLDSHAARSTERRWRERRRAIARDLSVTISSQITVLQTLVRASERRQGR